MIRLRGFYGKPGVFSVSFSLYEAQRKQNEDLNVLLFVDNICTAYWSGGMNCSDTSEQIFPSKADSASFLLDEKEKNALHDLEEDDVVEVDEKGLLFVLYSQKSMDCTLYVTSRCNSNCVMCPINEKQRAHDVIRPVDYLINISRHLPKEIKHITITGGEPFLLGKDIFKLLTFLTQTLPSTEILVLTNGRVFADMDYAHQYAESTSDLISAGIPIHGSTPEKHDTITQSQGSFQQTILGIRHLLYLKKRVDVRFVVSRLNMDDITNMAKMLVNEVRDIRSVKIMGLEMIGNAGIHEKEVWIPYRDAFSKSKYAAKILMENGIDVEFYNFPLCSVDRKYWGICRRSISDYKIRFRPECSQCREKGSCGGIFAGTMRLIDRVNPIGAE